MKPIIRWLKDALTTKRLVLEMAYYKVQGGQVRATDGRITAGHPYDGPEEFLVPGQEFERILARMGESILIDDTDDQFITIRSGRSRGTVSILPLDSWDYPGIAEEDWQPMPSGLLHALDALLPFVSDNANHNWAMGITLEDGWCYATNNVALAGVKCPSIGKIEAIMPLWAAEFILDRKEGLESWCWTSEYVAFRWASGAWMRSVLIDDKFPEQASAMIQAAVSAETTVCIDEDFREAYFKVADVAESSIMISAGEMSATFGKASMTEEFDIPELEEKITYWGAKFLNPVIKQADWWSPETWPNPAPFQGEGIVGYIVGRRS